MKKVLTTLLAIAVLALFGGTLWYLWHKAHKPAVVYDGFDNSAPPPGKKVGYATPPAKSKRRNK